MHELWVILRQYSSKGQHSEKSSEIIIKCDDGIAAAEELRAQQQQRYEAFFESQLDPQDESYRLLVRRLINLLIEHKVNDRLCETIAEPLFEISRRLQKIERQIVDCAQATGIDRTQFLPIYSRS